jgi:hypothetical protein
VLHASEREASEGQSGSLSSRMVDGEQLEFDFSESPTLTEQVEAFVAELICARMQPSSWELLSGLEECLGWKARWAVRPALQNLAEDLSLTRAARDYSKSLLESEDLDAALRGIDAPRREVLTGIDSLLRQSKAYRFSREFREMVTFMASFRDYAPYNNMLVRLQNPKCGFYATESDWERRFGRRLLEDARRRCTL